MRKFRIRLALTLFVLAAGVGGVAWVTESILSTLILYAVAVFLAWQSIKAFLGRINPPQRPAPSLHAPAVSEVPAKASDALSPPPADAAGSTRDLPSSAAGADRPDVLKATGEVVKDTALFLRRFLTVLVLLTLVPAMLLISYGVIDLLSQGNVLGAVVYFLTLGGMAWFCLGPPLRTLWGSDGGQESPVTEDHPKTENHLGSHGSGSAVPKPPSVHLTLPEQIVLLSYRYGAAHDGGRSAIACAGAEIGELVLRGRVKVAGPKHKSRGFELFLWPGVIQVVDATPTGLAWADELLGELERHSSSWWRLPFPGMPPTGSEGGVVALDKWFRLRGDEALLRHRDALTERGVLIPSPGFQPGQEERHYPDPTVRNELISWLRAVHAGRVPLDGPTMLLLTLLEQTRLDDELGLTSPAGRLFDGVYGKEALEAVPEEVTDISQMLNASISSLRRGTSGVGGGGDGGDGGE